MDYGQFLWTKVDTNVIIGFLVNVYPIQCKEVSYEMKNHDFRGEVMQRQMIDLELHCYQNKPFDIKKSSIL